MMMNLLIDIFWLLLTFIGALGIGLIGVGLFKLLPSSIQNKIEYFHNEE